MTVAGQLANLECQIHDEPDPLEKEHHKFDMDSEGAEEPIATKKDAY